MQRMDDHWDASGIPSGDDATRKATNHFDETETSDLLRKLPALGPIMSLYAHSPAHQHRFFADIRWLVIPPLSLNQCKLYLKKNAPVAFVSWAFLADETVERLLSGATNLSPPEWKGGKQLWIVDCVAPHGGLLTTMRDVRQNLFPHREISLLKPARNPADRVVRWPPLVTAGPS